MHDIFWLIAQAYIHMLYAYQYCLDLGFNALFPYTDSLTTMLQHTAYSADYTAALFWLYNVLSVFANSVINLG